MNIEGYFYEIKQNRLLAWERCADSTPGEFDAILMDVQIPIMNGYDASRKIRALERADAKTIQIIAMTANAFTEDVIDALEAGMDVHIAKPIDMALLQKTVSQYVIINKQRLLERNKV